MGHEFTVYSGHFVLRVRSVVNGERWRLFQGPWVGREPKTTIGKGNCPREWNVFISLIWGSNSQAHIFGFHCPEQETIVKHTWTSLAFVPALHWLMTCGPFFCPDSKGHVWSRVGNVHFRSLLQGDVFIFLFRTWVPFCAPLAAEVTRMNKSLLVLPLLLLCVCAYVSACVRVCGETLLHPTCVPSAQLKSPAVN